MKHIFEKIKAEDLIDEKERGALIKELIDIFPELSKAEVVDAVHKKQ